KAGDSCPPGMTEIRPRNCLAPEAPPPSILDYRPHSTLIAPAHLVKTAKYPAIDFHGHPQDLISSVEGLATLGAALDSLNVRMMISADNRSGDRLRGAVAAIKASPQMKDRVRVLAGINLQNVGPGWADRDNLFRKHPNTTFVAAHMGWHANNLGRLGKMLTEMPNVYTEVGAVLYDIGRQPRVAHDFFVKYQDRILFGKDSFQPEEYPYY